MLFVSTDEMRYVLNGIGLHSIGGTLHMVATDGRRLLVLNAGPSPLDDGEKIILPAPHFLDEQRRLGSNASIQLTEAGRAVFMVGQGDGHLAWSADLIPGDYPDFRKTMAWTDAEPAEGMQVNPSFLDSFIKAAQLVTDLSPTLKVRHAGNKAAYQITCGNPDFFGLLMPMCDDRDSSGEPARNFNRPAFIEKLRPSA